MVSAERLNSFLLYALKLGHSRGSPRGKPCPNRAAWPTAELSFQQMPLWLSFWITQPSPRASLSRSCILPHLLRSQLSHNLPSEGALWKLAAKLRAPPLLPSSTCFAVRLCERCCIKELAVSQAKARVSFPKRSAVWGCGSRRTALFPRLGFIVGSGGLRGGLEWNALISTWLPCTASIKVPVSSLQAEMLQRRGNSCPVLTASFSLLWLQGNAQSTLLLYLRVGSAECCGLPQCVGFAAHSGHSFHPQELCSFHPQSHPRFSCCWVAPPALALPHDGWPSNVCKEESAPPGEGEVPHPLLGINSLTTQWPLSLRLNFPVVSDVQKNYAAV